MKILVTGANGLLGQKLCDLLGSKENIRLIATARGEAVIPIRGEFYPLDISDAQQVDKLIALVKPEVIINTAAMTQVDPCELDHDACWKANVTGVKNIVKAAQQVKAHLVHVSTDFIFDGNKELLTEEDVPNPVNFYGHSKLSAERLVEASTTPWCIIRTVLVYGITHDMSRSNIVVWVKKSLEAGKTIQVVCDQFRTPTLAEDLATGCLLAAEKGAVGIYHVSGKDYMSVYEIATRTATYFKLNPDLIKPVASEAFVQPGRRPLKTGFVIAKAQQELGYAPRSFEEGIAVVAAQLK